MSKKRFRYLFFQHYQMRASEKEREELDAMIRSEAYGEELKLCIEEVLRSEKGDFKLSDLSADQILSSIVSIPSESLPTKRVYSIDGLSTLTSDKRKKDVRFSWWRNGVAASMLLIGSLIGFYLLQTSQSKETANQNEVLLIKDLPPGSDKAYLSLADGTKIDLKNQESQHLLLRHGISNDIQKGELVYHTTSSSSSGYSTLTTPHGGQYKLTLPDGSQAWLNAGSTIKFPNKFDSHSRTVEMSGEVYFEIASDPTTPFIVSIAGGDNQPATQVKVLGTQFNISSYADEPQVKTTLLEGSVEITHESDTKRLKPGQQAWIGQNAGNQKINVKEVDPAAAIAWKDGRFEFHDNIKDIMRQIARWYDVEVVYEGEFEGQSFAGSIPRENNVSEVLQMLELTGKIRFAIEGRTIFVKPVPI